MKKKLLLLLFLGLSTNIFSQSTIYVSTTGNDIGSTGLSAAPFATIQAAIDYSSDGDTVIVNPGTYIENIIYNGKNITITSLYSSTLNEDYIALTIIDGGANGFPVVRIFNSENNNAKLIGFTIQNGLTATNEWAAAIDINTSSPELKYLIIKNNVCANNWPKTGGICVGNAPAPVLIQNVEIKDNIGGAIYSLTGSTGSLNILNCKIHNNSTNTAASAIFFHGEQDSKFPIQNTLIYNNSGGNVIQGTNVVLLNSTLYNNNGIINIFGNSGILNSIIGSNHSINNQGMLRVSNSLIQDGQSSIINPIPSFLTYTNTISGSPIFANTLQNDFHLSNYSPAIGTGATTISAYTITFNSPSTDLDRNPRPNPIGSNPDIGAYENALSSPSNNPPTIDQVSDVNINESAPQQSVNLLGISDGDYLATQNITITATSNNTALIPDPTVIYSPNDISGLLKFTPVAGGSGTAIITITIQDDGGILNEGINTTIKTFTVNVAYVNKAPVAIAQTINSPEDTDLIITLSASDLENNTLTYYISSLPINGILYQLTNLNNIGTAITATNTLVSNPNKKVLFRPSLNENGLNYGDFTFKTNDSFLDGNTAQITLNITSVNDIPVCNSQNIDTPEDTDLIITLSGTDIEGDAMTAKITKLPVNGVLYQTNDGITKTNPILAINTEVTNSDKKVIFEPLPDENGVNYDTFYFTLSDGIGFGVASLITINVAAVNDRPISDAQSISTDEDTPISITLSGSDVEGSNLIYRITTLPSSGSLYQTTNGITLGTQIATVPLNVTNSNMVIYKPALNQNGNNIGNFQFKSYDGSAYSQLASIITIDVNPVNDAPIATAQTVSTLEDNDLVITLIGTDIENDPLTYSIYSLPTNGTLYQTQDGISKAEAITSTNTLVTNSNNKVIFEPVLNRNGNGFGNFYFKANDSQIDGLQSLITVNVAAVNDVPTALLISGNVVPENLNNQIAGVFSTTDADLTDTFTYQLVSGTGDTNNSLFTIIGNQLKNTEVFDYETQQSYSIRVKSTDIANTSTEETFVISVDNTNDISISSTVQNTFCNGSNASGIIDITAFQTNGVLSYSWSGPNGFNSTLEDISNLAQGVYTVTVTDSNYSKTQNITVDATPIYSALDLCYVTSDATDVTKNRINLSYSSAYNVDKFQILSEGSVAGQYDVIGEVNATETSFLDLTSINSASSYKYKVRTKDLCGNTSPMSAAHKTILLQSSIATNNTVNLAWTAYEGVAYGTYIIYRKVNDGLFEVLKSISSTNLNYNDIDANTASNNYSYYVSIAVDPCLTTQKTGKLANSAGVAIEIKSNQKSISRSLSTQSFELENLIKVFPNPTDDVVTVTIPESFNLEKIEVYNSIGQFIDKYNTNIISLKNQASGNYLLKIYTSGGNTTKKIIKL